MRPDLREARRLLDAGMRLVELKPYEKVPLGLRWNDPSNFARAINPEATGYGLPLSANKLCSIDPDRWDLACIGMKALGFDLESLMSFGVRTCSTRLDSGGRSTFAADGDVGWLKFNSKETGVVLEFRADSSNLQDCIPGVVYRTKDGRLCTQSYVTEQITKLDEAPPLPDKLWTWWEKCSVDRDFLNDQQRRFFESIGTMATQSISTSKTKGGKLQLAYSSRYRRQFNELNRVEDILERHGYAFHSYEQRWSPPTATGAPGIREIPGKDGLWQSDHASDPLSGTFDAWLAFVTLNHNGSIESAEIAFAVTQSASAAGLTSIVRVDHANGGQIPVQDAEHLLARFIDINEKARPPRWVINRFIADGIVTISGEAGVGKTTALVPLALIAAHLCAHDNPLRTKHWRHVVYISEDPEQVKRIIAGVRDHPSATLNLPDMPAIPGSPAIDSAELLERFHLVEARRMPAESIVLVAATYRKQFVRNVDGVELLPLVVFDTKAATIELVDENSNSEASKAIALLKQQFEKLPVWIVGHLPKAFAGKGPLLSMRGAGAFEADANQTLYITIEEKERLIELGKHRFEAAWKYLRVETYTATARYENEFGDAVPVTLRWGLPIPSDTPAFERKAQAADAARQANDQKLRERVLELVRKNHTEGKPLNRTAVCSAAGGRKKDVSTAIEFLLREVWLCEVPIPARIRQHPSRSSFLICLDESQRQQFMATGDLPSELLAIPPYWRKKETAHVPESELVIELSEENP